MDDEDELDALENALVEYDERGDLFGTSGAGAYFLARFLLDKGYHHSSAVVTGREIDLVPTVRDWVSSLPWEIAGNRVGWHYIDTQALTRLTDALAAVVGVVAVQAEEETK